MGLETEADGSSTVRLLESGWRVVCIQYATFGSFAEADFSTGFVMGVWPSLGRAEAAHVCLLADETPRHDAGTDNKSIKQ